MDTVTWPEVFYRLLDWPFLLFVFLTIFVWKFRLHVVELLSRGDITVSWGPDKNIRLKEIGESLGQELDPLMERLDALEARVAELSGETMARREAGVGAGALPGAAAGSDDPAATGETESVRAVVDRALEALEDPRYEWRTLDRVAAQAGASGDEVREVLRTNPRVVFGTNRSGAPLLKLKQRG